MSLEIERNQAKRNAFLKKFRTTTKDGYPTFDLEAYYNSLTTSELTMLRDKTAESLERYPEFGAEFYSDFVEYLNRKIDERTN